MPGGRNQSGHEKFIVMSDKAVEKIKLSFSGCEGRMKIKTSQRQCDMYICGCFSPELGSQGSMSSSSLGHSAEATSRSSADYGNREFRKTRSIST